MSRVFYYYYHMFYSRVLLQPDPHFETILAISAMESLWINGILDTFSVVVYCYKLGKWPMLGVLILLLVVNFKLYGSKSFQNKIVSRKQTIFDSHKLTILIVVVISLLGISWLFWGSFFTRNFLAEC